MAAVDIVSEKVGKIDRWESPTNYDSQKNFFDRSAVETVIELVLKSRSTSVMIIKSAISVGYTEKVRAKYNTD